MVGERAFPQQLTRESASSQRRYLRDPEHELVHCRQPVIANEVVPFLQDKERDGRTDVFHYSNHSDGSWIHGRREFGAGEEGGVYAAYGRRRNPSRLSSHHVDLPSTQQTQKTC